MIKNSLLTALFAVTLCLSAVLLFSAQPMIAKLLLPSLGGTPAVWNTCMVFFQTVLLAGYAYGHTVATRPRKATQISVHTCLILVALPFLPLALNTTALASLENASQPVFAVLSVLTLSIGLPIFVISTTAPLLQRWYSRTDHPNAADPYFLYSASNTGSLAALVAYPTLIEPNLALGDQRRLWSLGYLILGTLIILCSMIRWSARSSPVQSNPSPAHGSDSRQTTAPRWTARLRWIALAFVPSSWMLGITTYITTDIASVPLFWVVPLGLNLLTFILAFAQKPWVPYQLCERILPIGAVALIYLLLTQATQPVWLLILIHLTVFFVASLACHGRLAADRPDPEHLTEFYFWISLGGVTGGMFNALLAPLLFTRILEYPMTVIAGCLLRPTPNHNPAPRAPWTRLPRLVLPLLPVIITVSAAIFLIPRIDLPYPVRMALLFGLPLILVFLTVDVPWRFSLSLAGVLAASSLSPDGHGQNLFAERNFFGVLRVTRDPDGPFRRLVHGSTLHGRQFLDPTRRCDPLSYYHRSGPLQYIFKVAQRVSGCRDVAVVGLGIGSAGCYALPDQNWTFYEINPAVVRVAGNTNYFTLLNGCMSTKPQVILGDARLRIRDAQPNQYELILLDAFSSDSIPTHLMTREAVELYLTKLSPDGFLAFHISNRTLNLEPVLGDLAASLGLVCYAFNETEINPHHAAEGKDSSHWLVMARDTESLGNFPRYDTWQPVAPRDPPEIWTDDYSQILSVLNLN